MSFGSSSETNSSQKAKTTPVEQQEWVGLRDQLIKMAMSNLTQGADTTGYEATGIGNINAASDASRIARENALTARGLAGSPIAGNADIMSQNARAGDIAEFQNSLPLLQRDLANTEWMKALQLFSGRPIGQSSTATGKSTTETSQSMFPSLMSGLAGGLGQLIGGGSLTSLFSKKPAASTSGPSLNPFTGLWE